MSTTWPSLRGSKRELQSKIGGEPFERREGGGNGGPETGKIKKIIQRADLMTTKIRNSKKQRNNTNRNSRNHESL